MLALKTITLVQKEHPLQCENCRYWLQIEGEEIGQCRRFPPQIAFIQNHDVLSRFPESRRDSYCAEYGGKDLVC